MKFPRSPIRADQHVGFASSEVKPTRQYGQYEDINKSLATMDEEQAKAVSYNLIRYFHLTFNF